MLFFFCVALWFILRGVSCLVLPCSLFSCFSSFQHCDQFAWVRESWSMCLSCICFFILHALILSFFLFLWEAGVGCACDCGSPRTFLLTFLQQMAFEIYLLLTLSISLNTSRFLGNIESSQCTKVPRLGHQTEHFGTYTSSNCTTIIEPRQANLCLRAFRHDKL